MNRREFAKLALTAVPACALDLPLIGQERPSSKVRGVMVGMNVPYNFGGRNNPVEEIIQNCVTQIPDHWEFISKNCAAKPM